MKKNIVYLVLLIVVFFCGCSFNKKVDITLYSYRPELTPLLTKTIENYQSTHKKVTISIHEERNDAVNILKARFLNHEAEDIVMVPSYKTVSDFAEKNVLVDLSSAKFTSIVGDAFKKGATYDNKVYGFPLNIKVFGVFYNKDLFDQYNIGVPKTKDEFAIVAKTLDKNGIIPFATSMKDYWPLGFIFAMGHATVMGDRSDSWFTAMNEGIGSFRNENMQDVAEIFSLYKQYSGENGINSTYKMQIESFSQHKAAMMVQSLDSYQMIRKRDTQGKYGFFAMPFTNNSSDAKLFADIESVLAINNSISKSKKKIIVDYLNYLAGEECQQILFTNGRILTPFKVKIDQEMNPVQQDIIRYINDDAVVPWAFLKWPSKVFESSKEYVYQYLIGKMSFNEFMTILDDRWRDSNKEK